MTQTDQQNVPKLRFPGFDGKDFPDWEEKRLGEVLAIGSGRDYKHLGEGNIPVYGTGGLMKHVDDFLYDGESVCIGRKGTIDKPVFLTGKFWTVDTLFYTHSFNNALPRFIYAIFQQINWQIHNEASGVPSLSKSTIERLPVSLPHPDEQRKIASFLSAVDTKIAQLARKKALLEDYKTGCMQQLFSQAVRFKDEDGNDFPDWEERRLGEVAQIVGGGTPESGTSSYWSGGIPWFTPSEIKRKYLSDSQRTISDSGLRASSAKILPVGALLLSTRATVGDVGIARKECCTNQGFQSLVMKGSNVNEFWYYWIHANKREFLRRASGSTFLEIGKSEVSKINAKTPHPNEQRKIADFLSALDRKINLVGGELTHAQTFKQGLLQQMFV